MHQVTAGNNIADDMETDLLDQQPQQQAPGGR
jgi:hypothetical protein